MISGRSTAPALENEFFAESQRSDIESTDDDSRQAETLLEGVPVSNRFQRLSHDFEQSGENPSERYSEGPCLQDLVGPGSLEHDSGGAKGTLHADDPSPRNLNISGAEVCKRPRGGMLHIGLLNVNSINDAKFEYLTKRMEKEWCFLTVITELSSEKSDTIRLLEKHKKYPIVTDPENRRVGLMIPKLWRDHCEIVDTWNRSCKRKQSSQIAAQCTTYRITLSTFVCTISAVYIVPDAPVRVKEDLFEHMSNLSLKFPNYMSLGDYNMDAKNNKIRDFFKSACGGALSQIVREPTREKTRKLKGKLSTSSTTIDLAFLTPELKSKLIGKVKINKDSPSDHFMVSFCLDIKVPLKYAVKRYFLDTTRRPPIPKDKKDEILGEISSILEENKTHMVSLGQADHLNFIWETIKSVLDRLNPLNRSGELKKKIYRFTISKELKQCLAKVQKARNLWRREKRKSHSSKAMRLHARYKKLRNEKNMLVKVEKNLHVSSKIYDGIENASSVWEILRKFLPDPHFKAPQPKIEINGKTGVELANHMAKFFLERAFLVSDESAAEHADSIPFPTGTWPDVIDLDDSKKYDVKELFKPKKKPSLAAGPDTISHRHIVDLMPAIEDSLQAAVDKPLDRFQNINSNYIRLLNKETVTHKTIFTEKSQRPISELNVLPKYGSVKVFIDQLRDGVIRRLSENQFAFPGKGGPLATAKILDFASFHASNGKKVLIVLWDFSNAFCTTIHRITLEIAKKFNLSDRMIKLLTQFLEQTLSVIKVSDKFGFYLSEEIDTVRGEQQGQIGSDFIFAMINDGMNPEKVLDEIILRIKYVDDFTDIFVGDSASEVFESLKHNEKILKSQATSVGLRLNMDKLKIICLNIDESEYDPLYKTRGPGNSSVYVDGAKFLGFGAEIVRPAPLNQSSCRDTDFRSIADPIVNPEPVILRKRHKPKNCKITGAPAAKNLISRVNEGIRTICTLRKFEKNIELKVDAATALVWANCFDLGLILAYCGENSQDWKQSCTSIRRLLKSAGLDYMMSSDLLYKVTLKMDPLSIGRKQIIQSGLKMTKPDEFHNRSYKIKRSYGDERSPFRYRFIIEFNNLPLDLRKFIVSNLDVYDNLKMDAIKRRLKSHFIVQFDPQAPATAISQEKRKAILDRNLYSQAKVQKRKRAAEDLKISKARNQNLREKRAKERLILTPKPRKKAHSDMLQTPALLRKVTLCHAPVREPLPKAPRTSKISLKRRLSMTETDTPAKIRVNSNSRPIPVPTPEREVTRREFDLFPSFGILEVPTLMENVDFKLDFSRLFHDDEMTKIAEMPSPEIKSIESDINDFDMFSPESTVIFDENSITVRDTGKNDDPIRSDIRLVAPANIVAPSVQELLQKFNRVQNAGFCDESSNWRVQSISSGDQENMILEKLIFLVQFVRLNRLRPPDISGFTA